MKKATIRYTASLVVGILVASPPVSAKRIKLTGTLVDGLRLVDLASGKERRVRPVDQSCITDRSLMSPDGRRIALTCQPSRLGINDAALRVMDIDGENERVLVDRLIGVGFVWSPDSRFIAMKTGEMEDGIRILEITGQREWRLPVVIEGANGLGGRIFSWTSDGKSFFVLAVLDKNYSQFGLYQLNLNRPLSCELIRRFNTQGTELSLAPDEKHMAYIPWTLTRLIVSELQGENPILIKRGRKSLGHIFWSPDSQWVGAKQQRPNRMEVGAWTVWNITTKASVDLPVPYAVFHLQWWAPQTGTPPDCEKILLDALGPGKKLEGVHPLP